MPLSARSRARSSLVIVTGGVAGSFVTSFVAGWRWPTGAPPVPPRPVCAAARLGNARPAASTAAIVMARIVSSDREQPLSLGAAFRPNNGGVARDVPAAAEHGRLALLERVEATVVRIGVVPGAPRAGPRVAPAREDERRSEDERNREIPHGGFLLDVT